jgi:sigma-E factor negative regulatory protein RseB
MMALLKFSACSLVSFLLPVSAALAQFLQPDPHVDVQAMQWLQRIQVATQKLSYTGTFVYQHRDQMETSRITRFVDISGPYEKLESLGGSMPREIIRSGDQVTCYLPESMTVKIDRKITDRSFPAILPAQVKDLAENYSIRKGEVERVAGYECQVIVLSPKDKMRYGHKLWADLNTGMLLRAKTFDERNNLIETFEFTQLQLGNIDRRMVKSKYAVTGKSWKVENSAAKDVSLGWIVRSPPPGFRKVGEMHRTLGGTTGVGHIVLSDGLAAVSVFIEPLVSKQAEFAGLARQGSINVYTRRLGEHWITVVGEAPADSVKYFANAIEYRKPQ